MISKHVELGGKTENSAKTANSRHRAESVVIITDSVSAFAFNVLILYNESDFAFVEFTLSHFDLVLEHSILVSERCA